jgi:microcompartment protein CcmK/EutM
MQLARVLGTVVATKAVEGLKGVKMVVIQPLNHELQPVGGWLAACDVTQSGRGELVYFAKSREAAQALHNTNVAVDATVVAIVDAV